LTLSILSRHFLSRSQPALHHLVGAQCSTLLHRNFPCFCTKVSPHAGTKHSNLNCYASSKRAEMPDDKIPEDWTPEGHADAEGDVIFLLNTEHPETEGQYRSLKVSSHILNRASPVFKAMFDPRFTGNVEFSSANPREVCLPEDDCQATAWMCFALHSQYLPEGRIPLDLLKRLAILCDKYDCAR